MRTFPDIKTVAFTGHRPNKLYGYDSRASYDDLARKIATAISQVFPDADTFVTGGAQGVDQTAFWAMRNLVPSSRNIIITPFSTQASRWPDDALFGKAEYDRMLACADEVICLHDAAPVDRFEAIRLLDERNRAMVGMSGALFAVMRHDVLMGPNRPRGGTANCIRYARSQNVTSRKSKPIVVLDPFTFNLMEG